MPETRDVPVAAAEDCLGGVSGLLPMAQAREMAAAFKALADPTRVRLLTYIASSSDGKVCACHLPEALGISQSTLSFHMKKLHLAGLVSREQVGRWVHYAVVPEAVGALNRHLEPLSRSIS